MHSYQFHIGDFVKSTKHLSRLARSIYRELLDWYYDTERPIPKDMEYVYHYMSLKTKEERTAVQRVLNEFFNATDEGWKQARCEIEIEIYSRKRSSQSKAGRASAEKRLNGIKGLKDFNGRSTDVQRTLNSVEPTLTLTTIGGREKKPVDNSQETDPDPRPGESMEAYRLRLARRKA